MDLFLQLMVSGIVTGGIYALIATGFVIIYKATGVINFATGELMMLGAFFAYTAMEVARAPFLVALLVAAAGATALGALVERVVLRPLLGQMSEVAVSWRLRIGRAHRRAARCARAQPGSDPAAAGQGSCAHRPQSSRPPEFSYTTTYGSHSRFPGSLFLLAVIHLMAKINSGQ